MLNVPWRRRVDGTEDYIDREKLREEVQKCIDNDRQASDKLACYFTQIAMKILNSRNFNGYPTDLKEEMLSFAQYKFIKSMQTVDLSKAENIFNFYTRIVWLAYLTVIGKWKKAKAANIQFLENVKYKIETGAEIHLI